jgi:hypothetical protein
MQNKKGTKKIEEHAGEGFEIRVSSNPNLSLAEKKRLLQECVDFLLSLNSKAKQNNK